LAQNPKLNESLIIRKQQGSTLNTFTIYLDNNLLLAPGNFKTSSGLGLGQVKYFVSEPVNLYEGLFAEDQGVLTIGGIANAYEPELGKPWETGGQGIIKAPSGWNSQDFSQVSDFGITSNYLNPALNYISDTPAGNINYTLVFSRSQSTSDSSLKIQGLQTSGGGLGSPPLLNGQEIEFKFEDIYLLPNMTGPGGDAALGSGVLNQPFEPVNSAFADPVSDFNNLLRLVDLYEPTAFDTNSITWKEILTGPVGNNAYLGSWTVQGSTTQVEIEPQAIF
jgi:hypothetical protein